LSAEANQEFSEWINSIEADARVEGQRLGSLLQVRVRARACALLKVCDRYFASSRPPAWQMPIQRVPRYELLLKVHPYIRPFVEDLFVLWRRRAIYCCEEIGASQDASRGDWPHFLHSFNSEATADRGSFLPQACFATGRRRKEARGGIWLQELVKQTAKADVAHPDIKRSEAALDKMKETGARINVAIRKAEEQSKV
jgi:hypothetical protein